MKLLIALVSYLPETSPVYERRLKGLKNAITEYKETFPYADIVVFAQGYSDKTRQEISSLGVKLEEFAPHSCAHARNVALDYFQAHKEYSWILLSDDDTGFYNYYGIGEQVKCFDRLPDKVKYINSVCPQMRPFKEDILKNQKEFEENVIVKIHYGDRALNPCFIRQQDDIPRFDENAKALDDDIYFISRMLEGNYFYTLLTGISKFYVPIVGEGASVIDYTKLRQFQEYVYTKFGKTLYNNDKYNPNQVYHGKLPVDTVSIPRDKKYEFTEKEKTVRKISSNKPTQKTINKETNNKKVKENKSLWN